MYKRVLLKLSGESLGGPAGKGLDTQWLEKYAKEVASAAKAGLQIAIVNGGGNIFRGLQGVGKGFDRVDGDKMGMLATVINALALKMFIKAEGVDAFFARKWDEGARMADDINAVISTKTGDPTFDAYCEMTYFDNCLRGGFPVMLGNKVFYMYSRKHGDMERDYNYFTIAPEFFTQGNANFRDICQNRRCDILFTPFTGKMNVKMFLSLIQSDGFNPLKISEASFRMS